MKDRQTNIALINGDYLHAPILSILIVNNWNECAQSLIGRVQ